MLPSARECYGIVDGAGKPKLSSLVATLEADKGTYVSSSGRKFKIDPETKVKSKWVYASFSNSGRMDATQSIKHWQREQAVAKDYPFAVSGIFVCMPDTRVKSRFIHL